MMSLSLSWTYYRDRVSLLVKFELKKQIYLNTAMSWKIVRDLDASILYNIPNKN